MTTAQTLPNHSSFPNKLISDQTIHNFTSTKPLVEHEPLTKPVSHRTLRNSSATKMSLRVRDQADHIMLQGGAPQPSESIRKSEKNLQTTSSENAIHTRSDLRSNKSAGKWDRSSEETFSDKATHGNEAASSRKTSEDDTGYNTRKHGKLPGYLAETEDHRDISGSKKSVSDTTSNQQANGYHLRRTGGKSGHRDINFADDFEYEYPSRNLSSTDIRSGQSSNQRGKTQKGSPSGDNDGISGFNGEMTTTRGGNSHKSSGSKSNKQPNLYSMICTEEIQTFSIPSEMAVKGKHNDQMEETSLNCTEQLEDFKDQLQVEENSDSVDSSTRSPSVVKVDRHRKKESKCLNKLCLTDHKIPSLWSKEKINGSIICRVCLDAYNREQYCHFCVQIYLDDDTLAATDDKDWIECDSCGCWNHIQCEAAQGLKNIFTLLQRGRTYKYFCPPCRQGKNQKKAKTSSVAQESVANLKGNLSPSSPSTNTNLQKKKVSNKQPKSEHQRPPVDDWLVCDEGLEEPSLTKVRINDSREPMAEVSQTEEEEKVAEEEDPIKKRLDSLFSRASSKRRPLQWKPVVNVAESFGELDKLMNQYGGKKMQLTDQEIKSDLLQIKAFSKIGKDIQENNELKKVSEVEAQRNLDDMSADVASESDTDDKRTARNKNSRGKQQRRAGIGRDNARDRSSRAMKEDRIANGNQKEKERERDREKDNIKDSEKEGNLSTAAKMQLRMRKIN